MPLWKTFITCWKKPKSHKENGNSPKQDRKQLKRVYKEEARKALCRQNRNPPGSSLVPVSGSLAAALFCHSGQTAEDQSPGLFSLRIDLSPEPFEEQAISPTMRESFLSLY